MFKKIHRLIYIHIHKIYTRHDKIIFILPTTFGLKKNHNYITHCRNIHRYNEYLKEEKHIKIYTIQSSLNENLEKRKNRKLKKK